MNADAVVNIKSHLRWHKVTLASVKPEYKTDRQYCDSDFKSSFSVTMLLVDVICLSRCEMLLGFWG
jgi:hypothetical protein